MQAFILGKTIGNMNVLNDEAFPKLYDFLANSKEQHTVQDLKNKLGSFLPERVPAYSVKHLKRKLIDHFKSGITFTDMPRKRDVCTLKPLKLIKSWKIHIPA